MIAAYSVFFLLGVAIFFLMAKVSLFVRIGVALATFVIPSTALTIWIVRTGDKPPPDAVTVVPKPTTIGDETESKEP